MIISHKRRFAYVGPPKTASTSLHRWLSQPLLCDRRWTPSQGGQHSAVIPPEAAGYFTFASVRNPYERLLSLWRHSRTSGHREKPPVPQLSFPDFLAWLPEAPWFYRASQVAILQDLRLDGIVRVERLAEDLAALDPIGRLMDRLEPLPHLNQTRLGPWVVVWRPEWRNRAERLLVDDFAFLGDLGLYQG